MKTKLISQAINTYHNNNDRSSILNAELHNCNENEISVNNEEFKVKVFDDYSMDRALARTDNTETLEDSVPNLNGKE